ncbi:MAG: InlB B-repeat-containing protein [Clostridia bacterium]|nr:InlB B-repeat-containing protein [Clostridia bacterium]
MKLKRFGAFILCAIMLAMCVSCGGKTPSDGTTGGTTGVITIPTVENGEIKLPLEEIANAVKINATPATETQEIPLLIILVNFDANGNGVDDYETGGADAIKATGEQWAGTDIKEHYELYFHGEKSLTNYYLEMTMGAFCFAPIQLDKVPEGSDITEGCLEVTVNIPHPGATAGTPGLLNAQATINAIVNATDEYIDYKKLDVNGNNKLDETEFACVILNSGIERSTGTSKDSRYPFQVHGTSQTLPGTRDGVTFSKVTNIGEYEYRNGYTNPPVVTQIGTPAHELAHNLGAEDLYDTNRNGHGGATVAGWPRAYNFSLECNGNHLDAGASPAYLDPYHRIYLGWAEEKVVGDGVYTISSTTTNNYVVLRVNTPDPDEYYLVEIRLKTGFESKLTSGSSKGGIMVWHIDEALNRRYFVEGSASTSTALNGVRHDPAIVPLFRTGYDAAGQYMETTAPTDPFYYYDEADLSKAVFDSGKFRSVTKGYQSFNSYPSSWTGDKNYNLRIEVLSAPGEEMTVKISGSQDGRKDFAPVVSADYSEKTHNMLTVTGTIDALNDAQITECGVLLSTNADFTENLVKQTATLDGKTFSATFEGLNPQTKYYYMVYVESDHGNALDTNDTTTNSDPKEQNYIKISLYRGINDPDRAYDVKVNFGEKLVVNNAVMNKPGYTFEGWYYDEAFTKPYDINTVIQKGTEPFALYAKWTKN